jgi:hypothetical protein
VLINGSDNSVAFRLPPAPGAPWQLQIDTADAGSVSRSPLPMAEVPAHAAEVRAHAAAVPAHSAEVPAHSVEVPAHSLLVFVSAPIAHAPHAGPAPWGAVAEPPLDRR